MSNVRHVSIPSNVSNQIFPFFLRSVLFAWLRLVFLYLLCWAFSLLAEVSPRGSLTTSREGPLSTNMELCVLIALSIPSVPSPRGRGHLSCICYSFLGKRQIHKCPTGRPADSYKKPTVGLKNVCKCHTLGTRQKVCFQLCKNRAQKLAFWIRWITTFQWKRIVLQYRNQTDNNVWTHDLNLF